MSCYTEALEIYFSTSVNFHIGNKSNYQTNCLSILKIEGVGPELEVRREETESIVLEYHLNPFTTWKAAKRDEMSLGTCV